LAIVTNESREVIRLPAVVSGKLPGGLWDVVLENGHHVAGIPPEPGKKDEILFLQGQRIMLEVSPCDFSRGHVLSLANAADQA